MEQAISNKRTLVSPEEVFKSLGHPARLTMVELLSEEEHCVCDLVEAVGLGWSTVSRHLSVLREAGVVADEKRGLQVWYNLRVPCILKFFGCVEDVLRANVKQARKVVSR